MMQSRSCEELNGLSSQGMLSSLQTSCVLLNVPVSLVLYTQNISLNGIRLSQNYFKHCRMKLSSRQICRIGLWKNTIAHNICNVFFFDWFVSLELSAHWLTQI
ncbi:N-alpha-acetyltransferase 40 [Platysternon megacephalum]|uniref:N-alpha-acetyltransferase 40 n=1 Tax=Platysternon megacephalum TaxID=55544 RepID=A0A4D9EZ98_9SAUR|nr:N-alpha-acetyltransferase 40 [Platysternon megacephalum]